MDFGRVEMEVSLFQRTVNFGAIGPIELVELAMLERAKTTSLGYTAQVGSFFRISHD